MNNKMLTKTNVGSTDHRVQESHSKTTVTTSKVSPKKIKLFPSGKCPKSTFFFLLSKWPILLKRRKIKTRLAPKIGYGSGPLPKLGSSGQKSLSC